MCRAGINEFVEEFGCDVKMDVAVQTAKPRVSTIIFILKS